MIGLKIQNQILMTTKLKKNFINIPRDELLKRIFIRTEVMFKNNCIDEVKKFNALKINRSLSK